MSAPSSPHPPGPQMCPVSPPSDSQSSADWQEHAHGRGLQGCGGVRVQRVRVQMSEGAEE